MRHTGYVPPLFPTPKTQSSTASATIHSDGHGYLTEATIGGEYDGRSGTLYDFVAFRKAIQESLEPWRDRHLDLETEDFRNAPSTGENIVRALWAKIDNRVNQQLVRLRLWETANNRFTLRRT